MANECVVSNSTQSVGISALGGLYSSTFLIFVTFISADCIPRVYF